MLAGVTDLECEAPTLTKFQILHKVILAMPIIGTYLQMVTYWDVHYNYPVLVSIKTRSDEAVLWNNAASVLCSSESTCPKKYIFSVQANMQNKLFIMRI